MRVENQVGMKIWT